MLSLQSIYFPCGTVNPKNPKNLSEKYYSKYLKIATWEHSYHHSCNLVQYNKSDSQPVAVGY